MLYYQRSTEPPFACLSFYEQAGLLGPADRVIALVGAGGKTSSLFMLAEAYAAQGLRVAVTTSTHMGRRPGGFIASREELERYLAGDPKGRICLCASPSGEHKMSAPDFMDLLPQYFDRVLIEADGSRRLPLKIPADYEPVIPDYTDAVLVLAGLSALGRPLGEVCHRLEIALRLLAKQAADPVGPADVAALLTAGYVEPFLQKNFRGGVLLNQADDAGLLAEAEKIAALLPPVPVLAQCLIGDGGSA